MQDQVKLKLIRILFAMFMFFVTISVVLLVTLKINETVSIPEGEILASNSVNSYIAPFDAVVERVLVKEGMNVSVGDTLIVLRNSQINSEMVQDERDLESLIQADSSLNYLKSNLTKKIDELKSQIRLIPNPKSRVHSSSSRNNREKLESLEQELYLVKEKMNRDNELKKQGVLSQVQFEETYQKYLQKNNEYVTLKNQFQREYYDLNKQILDIEFEVLEIDQKLKENEIYKEKLESLIILKEKDHSYQWITSEIEGKVQFVFNSTSNLNIVSKGMELIRIDPKQENSYYAKLNIQPYHLKSLTPGQQVILKLKEYNHFVYGIVNGNVSYVSSRSEEKNFHILVDIKDENPNIILKGGYGVQGQVILNRVRLYKYLLKKVFKEKI
ncbi:MAG: HlyD family efflux transporter periplasmic adaptor subunit [Chitinophagales bacterium]|nr:HlyD family efflux transporter periplasmic adaptor subunit [Chitinophagales bacterium]